mmetsp:Transcript_90546/g.180152  ORF Transcript_90546/g.180152 Transcript_90546/m.180152 type:complete len:447 (+) Transcript_90546:37-1377(+)
MMDVRTTQALPPPAVAHCATLASVDNAQIPSLEAQPLQPKPVAGWISWRLIGPGLLVCLADTDAGCLIVAAQSGARWGYSLLMLQIILIPVLFLTQELTVRLGVHSGEGHTACIRRHFGAGWAWFACILLVFECICAMMSEMSGVAAVGEMFGFGRTSATITAAMIVATVVLCCNYRQIEVIGVTLGLFELVFVVTMFCFHPSPMEVFVGSLNFHSDAEYIKLVAANIGAVIMPWMIYFQQSAVVARHLTTPAQLAEERANTLVGSILTQLVMIGTLVTLAASPNKKDSDLDTVQDIAHAMSPVLGEQGARILVSLGFVGGSLCAAFVVSLAAAWAVCEAAQWDVAPSLHEGPTKAPHFYLCFLSVVGIGIAVLLTGINIVTLNVLVELLDGLLLPFAAGFLFFLATGDALPPDVRVCGWHKHLLAAVFTICTMLSVSTAIYGLVA